MSLISNLQNIGLDEKEAQVYIVLVQNPKTTTYTIAKLSGLKRPTVYVVLENLINKGIVKKIPREKTTQYSAISPEDLFANIKTRIENAEKEALPELQALKKSKSHRVQATYYEGMNSIKQMYKRLLKETAGRESIGFYGHQQDVPQELKDYWQELNRDYRKHQISRRILITDDPTVKYYLDESLRMKDRKIKALPATEYNSNVSVEVYRNYTLICSSRYLQAMLIDNPDVASTILQIFEIVWNRKQ
jgi:sugar-specific transcriptional regulator TrmB